MKKLIFAFCLLPLFFLSITIPAQATSIPPTAECQAIFEQEFKKSELNGDSSDARLAKALFDRGCLSSDNLQADFQPDTEVCLQTANDFQALLVPLTAKTKRFWSKLSSEKKKIQRLAKQHNKKQIQFKNLAVAGNKKAALRVKLQVKKLFRQYKVAKRTHRKIAQQLLAQVSPTASAVTLSLFDALSRGCVRYSFVKSSASKAPVGNTEISLRSNWKAVSVSVLALLTTIRK
jgi:hypothetical protein